MDITPLIPQEKNVIKGYGNKTFNVSETEYKHSLLILPDKMQEWMVNTPENITIESLEFISDNSNDIEILLIGCGELQIQIPAAIHMHFSKHNIGVEVMTTGAACRTYNVLLSEERKVAAALILI